MDMNETLDSREMCREKSVMTMTSEESHGNRWKNEMDTDSCDHEHQAKTETRPLQQYPGLAVSTIDPSSHSDSTSPSHVLTATSSSIDGCTSGSSTSSLNSIHRTSNMAQTKPWTHGVVGPRSSQSFHHNHLQQNHGGFPIKKDPAEDCNLSAPGQIHKQAQGDSIISTVSTSLSPSMQTENKTSSAAVAAPSTTSRATSMIQVKAKYMTELDYMLREFKKLERQLLGAKACVNGVEESSGSKERREKLHSFIIHLEDTIRQIENGCKDGGKMKQGQDVVGGEGNPTENNLQSLKVEHDEDGISGAQRKEKGETFTSKTDKQKHEEAVRKLEDHIRINLLPVKVRLSKQLAAQLGASQNPVGMPVARSGIQPTEVMDKGKGTFAAAAEKKRVAQMKQQHSERTTLPSTPSTAITVNHDAGEIQSQFGKPLGSAGSSLTHKLHGETLGSESRPYGYGVGSVAVPDISSSSMDIHETASSRKKMVAGVAPGCDQSQIISTVSSVTGAHRNFFGNLNLESVTSSPAVKTVSSSLPPAPPPSKMPGPLPSSLNPSHIVANPLNPQVALNGPNDPSFGNRVEHNPALQPDHDSLNKATSPVHNDLEDKNHTSVVSMTLAPRSPKKSLSDPTLTLEERAEIIRRRLQKKKRRLMSEQQPTHEIEERTAFYLGEKNDLIDGTDSIGSSSIHLKKNAKIGSLASTRTNSINRNGPKAVEYICALCNEPYSSTCDSNPWWTLNTQECPKCLKVQIPRIDIASPANEIEYHPALLVQAAEDNNVSLAMTAEKLNLGLSNQIKEQSVNPNVSSFISSGMKTISSTTTGVESKKMDESDQDSASDLDFGPIDGDDLSTSDSESGSDFGDNMTLAARAEHEEFGKEYSGPKFMEYDSSRLLILMNHASTCPGLHKNPRTRTICRDIKLLMLHVRDCPGTTSCSDICPFPWCRKTKHLLYHLASCPDSGSCKICSRNDLSANLEALKGLNDFRMKKRAFRLQLKSVTESSTQFHVTESMKPSQMTSANSTVNHPSSLKSSSSHKTSGSATQKNQKLKGH